MRNLIRLIAINFTLARFGLDEIILSMHFFRTFSARSTCWV
jgi:hypothetical protein